ncbi:oligopeptide transporter ATP-binding component [Sulfitobacter sp. HI0082]|uniref:oligopeptide/dipeptide ABC transporter ATP-binding protein n=1 Tax=unclassified Sulfitobacter TaxID=196795 RepID=UPI0007C3BFBE|nr:MULTISPECIES: oligopeptide/dipeptide ABC transporter ATP-binding protein [unclassified Sulfitobacter]KZZ21921.1 oligopeptide transporter ATP-binding component [Sulfitobacter sp. HI0082]MBD83223.1 oligopeptide ABC transporter ATP-binding protein OppD [Sulfitobacter sp.]KZX97163.1 oligopeptide transporter ATP-binding component [Sulfitobacter sp. HI0021]KZY03141.1 oligopeptide transporter ATP-binding component [Sulfitobacter sp. HI0027]KZZ00369.1 oligopeptide transporter ATP-binding component |tara:strand:+ start:1102 stop:2070 length:969 start_codon:yes stop_codon:yes gene_type:complete
MSLLEIDKLSVTFDGDDGPVHAVNDLSLSINRGETLGIVGESGSGKSQTAFSIMGLLAPNGRTAGSVRFDGQEILGAKPKVLNKLRAERIAMIFQDPMTSLNPYMRIADQMTEVLTLHKGMSKRDALAESVRMLDAVKIPAAKERIRLFPHEFSGGMRQRVMIAMSLLCKPDLLIADEPTTALDVTVQAQIMDLLGDLQKDFGMATILITHDLGVVAGFCERVLVMYGGRVMEQGPTEPLFAQPTHPYTRGLLAAVPRVDDQDATMKAIPGNPPNMAAPPQGCPFRPRCTYAGEDCRVMPPLAPFAEGRARACHRPISEVTA